MYIYQSRAMHSGGSRKPFVRFFSRLYRNAALETKSARHWATRARRRAPATHTGAVKSHPREMQNGRRG